MNDLEVYPCNFSMIIKLFIDIINLKEISSNLSIPFPSEREADVAYQVLRVDSEPSRSSVTKTLVLESNTLKV